MKTALVSQDVFLRLKLQCAQNLLRVVEFLFGEIDKQLGNKIYIWRRIRLRGLCVQDFIFSCCQTWPWPHQG